MGRPRQCPRLLAPVGVLTSPLSFLLPSRRTRLPPPPPSTLIHMQRSVIDNVSSWFFISVRQRDTTTIQLHPLPLWVRKGHSPLPPSRNISIISYSLINLLVSWPPCQRLLSYFTVQSFYIPLFSFLCEFSTFYLLGFSCFPQITWADIHPSGREAPTVVTVPMSECEQNEGSIFSTKPWLFTSSSVRKMFFLFNATNHIISIDSL
jgi:hypothetical protein